MSVNISLTHVLSGIIGFLLGSASVVNGAKKRNPLTFILGLLFLLGSAYACFLALVSATVEEYEDEEDDGERLGDDEEPQETSAPVQDAPDDEPAPDASDVAEPAPDASDVAEPAPETPHAAEKSPEADA